MFWTSFFGLFLLVPVNALAIDADDDAPPAVAMEWQDAPAPPAPPTPPPAAERRAAPRPRHGPSAPGPGGDAPRARRGVGGAPVSDEVWDSILPVLEARRPELAKRLRELREKDPQRANDVLHEALVNRIEEALDGGPRPLRPGQPGQPPRAGQPGRLPRRPGAGPGGAPPSPDAPDAPQPPMPGGPDGPMPPDGLDGPFPPGGMGGPRPPRPPHIEADPRVRELQQEQSEADRHSREMAEQLRHGGEQMGEQEREAVRTALRAAVEKQFELRSQLRAVELERIGDEVQHLQRRLDAVRAELERREAERGAIIERRMKELLGREHGGD